MNAVGDKPKSEKVTLFNDPIVIFVSLIRIEIVTSRLNEMI